MNQTPQAPLQPIPEKVRLEMVDEMEIEIIYGSQNSVNFRVQFEILDC